MLWQRITINLDSQQPCQKVCNQNEKTLILYPYIIDIRVESEASTVLIEDIYYTLMMSDV